eukprot:3348154-Heterocapsa_arctica.AAC.1
MPGLPKTARPLPGGGRAPSGTSFARASIQLGLAAGWSLSPEGFRIRFEYRRNKDVSQSESLAPDGILA